jgi:hypothetical protein
MSIPKGGKVKPPRKGEIQHPDIDGPTEVAGRKVRHDVALAKRIGTKVTVLSVPLPFRVFKMDCR